MKKAFDTYFGGKGADGTFQTIINHIRPHNHYFELFAGNDAIARHKALAIGKNILVEIDNNVYDKLNSIMTDYYVINQDALYFIENYLIEFCEKNEGVCVYVDPPYPISSRKSLHRYPYELTDFQHFALINLLKKLKADVLLSTYPNDMYKQNLSEWKLLEYQTTTRKGSVTECLFMNYHAIDSLHQYNFLGNNHRERELNKRKTKRYVSKFEQMPLLLRNKIIKAIISEVNL